MNKQEIVNVLGHLNKTEEHVIGFRLANGGRIMYLDEMFSIEKHVLDGIGMLYKPLEDNQGCKAHSYTELNEIINILLVDDLDADISIREIVE